MTTDPTETETPVQEEEDVVRMVAEARATEMMARFVGKAGFGVDPRDPSNWGDFEQRISGIITDKGTMGRSVALMQKYVPECKGDSKGIYEYCMGTYWTSLTAVMGEKNPGNFMNKDDPNYTHMGGSPHISTYAAINWFETITIEDFNNCGQSMRDFPFKEQDPAKQTVGQMLREGYRDGTIPIGSLVMVRRDGGLLHAVMFAGFNENGEPLFSCANNEHIRETMPSWANQKLGDRGNRAENHDVYVVNMQQALAVKIEMEERQLYNSMNRDEYIAAHQSEIEAYQLQQLQNTPIHIEPRRIDRIDIPETPLVFPEREQIELPTSTKGSFGERLYGLLHYRRFHPKETEQNVGKLLNEAYQLLQQDPRLADLPNSQRAGAISTRLQGEGRNNNRGQEIHQPQSQPQTTTQTQNRAPSQSRGSDGR